MKGNEETSGIGEIIKILNRIFEDVSEIKKAVVDMHSFDPQNYSRWNSTWIEYREPKKFDN